METFAPSPAELVKRYGARKLQSEKYEVSASNLPWVIKRDVALEILPGRRYVVEGVQLEGLPQPWEAYVALLDERGEFGVGYIVAKRRRMFKCIYKTYTRPPGLQVAPYITIKPVELHLTDKEGLVDCIERPLYARTIAVFINAPPDVINGVKVAMAEPRILQT